MLTPRLQAAFDLMTRAHAGQARKCGRPYATHPAAVRDVLVAELHVTDEDAQVAALLHDVVEDTRVTLAEVESAFGPRAAAMVDVLSKPPAAAEAKADMLDRYYARLRSADPVVRQVKLADRVHNLRDMAAATLAFRARYLRETELLLSDVLAGTPGIEVLRAEYERCLRLYAGEVV